jgi:hypothetical protein
MWRRGSPNLKKNRLALALWAAWAVIAWNVVFDHVIVVAGREYLTAAAAAASHGGPFLKIDDWMQPAVPRALREASASAAAILIAGIVLIRLAMRRTHKAAPHGQV